AQKVEEVVERKTMLRSEREHDGVVVGRRLQLEIERATEPLSEQEPEAAIDARSIGRVHDQLHATRLVEKPLHDEASLCGKQSERLPRGSQVFDQRARRRATDAARLLHPG